MFAAIRGSISGVQRAPFVFQRAVNAQPFKSIPRGGMFRFARASRFNVLTISFGF